MSCFCFSSSSVAKFCCNAVADSRANLSASALLISLPPTGTNSLSSSVIGPVGSSLTSGVTTGFKLDDSTHTPFDLAGSVEVTLYIVIPFLDIVSKMVDST